MLATKQELMLDRNKDIKDFVDEFTDGARNRNRYRREIEEILKGLDNGLALDQIRIYANREFKPFEMEQIRLGLEHGLSEEQVKVYAKPEFKWPQMREVREGFESGLTLEQVGNSLQMQEIRKGFAEGLSMEQVKAYADPRDDFEKMAEIREGLKIGKYAVISPSEEKFNPMDFDLEKLTDIIEEEKDGK